MKINYEESLRDFGFWSGAEYNRNLFTDEELDSLESILETEYPDGITETELNDLFWFEDKYLCELIGIDYENDYLKRESSDSD